MNERSDKQVWRIQRNDELVGTATITDCDSAMNVRSGLFAAGPGYASIQSVFQSFAAANGDPALLANYYRDRDALGLTVVDETGNDVVGTVHVLDFTASTPGVPLEIEIYPQPMNEAIQQADAADGASRRR